MPYVSIDELEHFEFHDAEVVSIELKEQCMKWMTKFINATKENTQNSFQIDMCVSDAEVIFASVEIKSIIYAEFKSKELKDIFSNNRELILHEKPREAYASILSESVSAYCRIFGMCMEEAPADGKHKYSATFTIDGGAGIFDIQLDFDQVVILWNEFNGKAWYEEDKWKRNMTDNPSSPSIQ